MALSCPACDEAVRRSDVECPSCGTELNPVTAPPPAPTSDSTKYMIIVGSLVIGAAILIFISSGMGTSSCGECKGKGVSICQNCKGGSIKCGMCKGNGSDPQTFSTCARCNGSGTSSVCTVCKGNSKRTCGTCQGVGTVK
jgi:hypothetical protein